MSGKKVYVVAGTHKGAFLFESDLARKNWQLKDIFFKGVDVHHLAFDTREEMKILACVNNSWWGPDVRYSYDFGKNWVEHDGGIRFAEGSDRKVERVWYVKPGRESEPQTYFAGVDPGALFRSDDGGETWHEVEALAKHPTAEKWHPGFGGLMVHSICLHPTDKNIMHVGISAAGTFSTEDNGQTWEPRNKGVLADFQTEKYPEFGQCVHHMDSHPDKPEVLYQQNHCGVYRSDNAGKEWIDLGAELPSRFGFPLVIHPHDPDTIYVIPETGAEFRCVVDGEMAVYRSENRGENWEKLAKGLPKQAYLNILRHAMDTDDCDSAGIYFGTNTGQLFHSTNSGDSWQMLADFLPPIFSVTTIVI